MLYVVVGNDLIQELSRVQSNLRSRGAYSCCIFKPTLLRTFRWIVKPYVGLKRSVMLVAKCSETANTV
jgi:hypothetical protein